MLVYDWNFSHDTTKIYIDRWGYHKINHFNSKYLKGMYVNYYNKKWYAFLKKWIDNENGPSMYEWFRKDKKLEFKFKSVFEV